MSISVSILSILLAIVFWHCSEEKPHENILEKKVSLDTADIRKLIEQGLMTDTDRIILVKHLMKNPGFNLQSITYAELLDVLKEIKKLENQKIAEKNNFGSDSVFLKNPRGERFFVGLGAMTFEEIVEKESYNLPVQYPGKYNILLHYSQQSIGEIISELSKDETDMIIMGNVLFTLLNDKTYEYKIGDIKEIGKRIRVSKEFAPFVNTFKVESDASVKAKNRFQKIN